MKLGRLQTGLVLLFSMVGVAISAQVALGKKKDKPAAAQMDQRKQAVHVLNRLTFGPRLGEVDQVMAIGVDKWIDQQLHPERSMTARSIAALAFPHFADGHARNG